MPVWGWTGTGGWGCLGSCSNNENICLGLCGLRGDDSPSRRGRALDGKAIPPWRESPDSQPAPAGPSAVRVRPVTAQETLFGFSAKAYVEHFTKKRQMGGQKNSV